MLLQHPGERWGGWERRLDEEKKKKVSEGKDGGEKKKKRLGTIRSLSGFRTRQRETSIFRCFRLPRSPAKERPAALVVSQPLLFQSQQHTQKLLQTPHCRLLLVVTRCWSHTALPDSKHHHTPNLYTLDPPPWPPPDVSLSCGAGAATSCWRCCPTTKSQIKTLAACRLKLPSGSASYLDEPEAAAVQYLPRSWALARAHTHTDTVE